MSIARSLVSTFLVVMIMVGSGMVSGQDYPNKPIRILAAAAGGGTDVLGRQIAQAISGSLGQPVIVENRGGVTYSIEIVSKANPDGYTLLVGGSTIWTLPLLQSKPLWDPIKDFAPITPGTATPAIVCVYPALPVKSIKELIALAKAKPGALNYGFGGLGSASHLAAELFKSMAGVDIVGVNYKANGPATIATASGEMQMTIGGSSAVVAIRAGKVRALAVASLKPSALFPEMPTVAASGLPGYEAQTVNVVVAPAKTPTPIIRRLNQEIVRLLSRPEVKARFLSDGQEVDPATPEEFAARIKSEMALMSKMIKSTGLRIEGE